MSLRCTQETTKSPKQHQKPNQPSTMHWHFLKRCNKRVSLSLSLSEAEPLCRNAMAPQHNENTHSHTGQQGSSSSSSSSSSSRAAARASEVDLWRSVEHLQKHSEIAACESPTRRGRGKRVVQTGGVNNCCSSSAAQQALHEKDELQPGGGPQLDAGRR